MTADTQPRVEIMKLSTDPLNHKKAITMSVPRPKYVAACTTDRVLLCDRIIEEMLRGERFYIPTSSNYMQRVQTGK